MIFEGWFCSVQLIEIVKCTLFHDRPVIFNMWYGLGDDVVEWCSCRACAFLFNCHCERSVAISTDYSSYFQYGRGAMNLLPVVSVPVQAFAHGVYTVFLSVFLLLLYLQNQNFLSVPVQGAGLSRDIHYCIVDVCFRSRRL